MADEIDVSVRLTLNENGAVSALKSFNEIRRGQLKVTQTTARKVANVQSITTTHAALAMGGVTTAGYGFFQNLDATNYIEIGIDVGATFHPTVRLRAGEVAVFRLTTNAPYAKANTATCKLNYEILEA